MDPFMIVGFVGVAFIVAAYFANQQAWLGSDDWRFPTTNLVGSLLILVSLYYGVEFPVGRDRGDLVGDQPVRAQPTVATTAAKLDRFGGKAPRS